MYDLEIVKFGLATGGIRVSFYSLYPFWYRSNAVAVGQVICMLSVMFCFSDVFCILS